MAESWCCRYARLAADDRESLRSDLGRRFHHVFLRLEILSTHGFNRCTANRLSFARRGRIDLPALPRLKIYYDYLLTGRIASNISRFRTDPHPEQHRGPARKTMNIGWVGANPHIDVADALTELTDSIPIPARVNHCAGNYSIMTTQSL